MIFARFFNFNVTRSTMIQDLILFFERDLRKLIDELNAFRDEENIWKTHGAVKNSCGNLVLHITGGTNYLIGTTLGHTGYVRNRELEFKEKNIARTELVRGLEELIPTVKRVLESIGETGLANKYPFPFDGAERSNQYVLTQLTLHLNYHLGQVNYLRRVIEP